MPSFAAPQVCEESGTDLAQLVRKKVKVLAEAGSHFAGQHKCARLAAAHIPILTCDPAGKQARISQAVAVLVLNSCLIT